MDLSYDRNSSELTCVTSGGQATSVYGGSMDSTSLSLRVTFNPRKMLYSNVLNLNTLNNNFFICINRNEMITYFATLLTKFGEGM